MLPLCAHPALLATRAAMAIQLMREEVRLAQEQQAEAQGQQGDGGDAEGGEHAGTPAGAPLVFDDSREMTYVALVPSRGGGGSYPCPVHRRSSPSA